MLFTCAFTFAQQDFQGKAYYESKTTVDMDNFGPPDMPADRKKQIMERMKSFLEKSYTLTFNKTESVYKEEEQLAAPGASQGRGFGGMMSSFTAGEQYKNVKNNQLLQEQEFFGKQFLINDSLPKLKWKMTGETKQIGQYMAMKATAMKAVDKTDFSSFRRRGGGNDSAEKKSDSTKVNNPIEEIEVPKEIEVTAWYTMQIPVNQGPGEYWGLPGLILEINADRTTILCSKIVLNPTEKETIKVPSKGKEVTKEEYADIVVKKMEEMREMYGGRGGRGGRPGGRGR
ncbi:GLPGLI family protein [Lacinutrix sp. C3R15]|nr:MULTISPECIES: GLPGLI family protein [Flavobacteriaceae]MBU2939980.1 GLPGLI family protein [Lacinutrix sp. C3R15]MDO6623297.1 GLPGLI family protein [Oceanihabitans sp. 1_MG-2023]